MGVSMGFWVMAAAAAEETKVVQEVAETVADTAEATAEAVVSAIVPGQSNVVEAVAAAVGAPVAETAGTEVAAGTSFFQGLWSRHAALLTQGAKAVLLSVLVLAVAWVVARVLKAAVRGLMRRLGPAAEGASDSAEVVVGWAVWVFAIIMVLDIFGVNTTSFLTILGAAGLAIGLALRDTLTNIAAGLALLAMRPFKPGDYIDCAGGSEGTVSRMGLFTTELTTKDGLFVSIPNVKVFEGPVKNYSRNGIRRMAVEGDISYGDDLAKGVAALERLAGDDPGVLREPAPKVVVTALQDSSVHLRLLAWAKVGDYWDVYYRLNGGVKGALEGAGLSIPFPQVVVTYAGAGGGEARPGDGADT